MDSPMITECEALRAEVTMLADENRRLLNNINELRKAPVYPEAAVRAVWAHGHTTPGPISLIKANFADHAEEVARVFTEALRDA